MDAIEIEHRITEVEQRAKSNTHRIDKLEPIVEEIHTMSKTMVQLVEEVKHTNENVCALDERWTVWIAGWMKWSVHLQRI